MCLAEDLHPSLYRQSDGSSIVKVSDLLRAKSATVITMTAEQSLLEASQRLTQHNIGAVVIVDGEGTPVGILSERDIVRQLAEHPAEAVNLPIQDAMTEDVIIALPDDDLNAVSVTMTDKRIRHLPVMG
jgi:CBS domain-containing protein